MYAIHTLEQLMYDNPTVLPHNGQNLYTYTNSMFYTQCYSIRFHGSLEMTGSRSSMKLSGSDVGRSTIVLVGAIES